MAIKVKMSEEEAKRIAGRAFALSKRMGWPTENELAENELAKLRVTFTFKPSDVEKFANGEMTNPFKNIDIEEIRKIAKLKHHKIQEVAEIVISVK